SAHGAHVSRRGKFSSGIETSLDSSILKADPDRQAIFSRTHLTINHQENAMLRKTLIAAVLAATLGPLAAPAFSAVVVRVAPPPPREEVVPAPRRGYTWVNGYWDYR